MQKVGVGLGKLAMRGSSAPWRTLGAPAAAVLRAGFHASRRLDVVKPFILADIGEGIKEVQIIQWFVQPGARVEQFDKICEVQSDKASVEITSRFDGVIKKLHYEADAMAQVGRPLLDIDITGDIAPQDEKLLQPEGEGSAETEPSESDVSSPGPSSAAEKHDDAPPSFSPSPPSSTSAGASRPNTGSNKSAALATPAVRGLLKEMNLSIHDIQGTGKDGRVLKEDIHNHVAAQRAGSAQSASAAPTTSAAPPARPPPRSTAAQQESTQSLTSMQAAMFRSMTKSLSIPHFLCASEVDLTALNALRQQLNTHASSTTKLSSLPFIIKAVSLALDSFPLLNARLDTTNSSSPRIVYRTVHNIGVAMDTPSGLLVPNVKDVASLSIREISASLTNLAARAKAGKLTPDDLKGGTLTVSNIGSIGGSYATPLLVEGEVAIVAVGRARAVPAFDEAGDIVKRDIAAFNWQADHRIVDGATLARMGKRVAELLEEPGAMMVDLR